MAQAKLDSIGWAYNGIAIGWTISLIFGMIFLYRHRHIPCIRIRRLSLFFTGVITLHIYGILTFLAYVIGPVVPCSAVFWLMSIYLPFGFAMFHAANSQFLHIASRQKQYLRLGSLHDEKPLLEDEAERLANSRWRRRFRGIDRADNLDRMMLYIAIGLLVELLLTLFVYFGATKFHPSYGLWELSIEGSAAEIQAQCFKGWEWWLSIVWQFFWAWIYAPYLLWKTRGVHDVHGWRLQTFCCCLAGLPATPLWLTALYTTQFASVNAVFPPPVWLGVSVFSMEVVVIGFPIVEIFKSRTLKQETIAAVKSWEERQRAGSNSPIQSHESEYSSRSETRTSKSFSLWDATPTDAGSFHMQKSDLYAMVGLEKALHTNPIPLLHFAALKDFSGENLSFLIHVSRWRVGWMTQNTKPTDQHIHEQFIAAVRLYAHFVSPDFSEFPINISSRDLKKLYAMFEGPASQLLRGHASVSSKNSITPFNDASEATSGNESELHLNTLSRANLRWATGTIQGGSEEALADITIPEAFSEGVFDAAEHEVKYLVLTNTWPRFVNAGCEARQHDLEKEELQTHPRWLRRSVLCSS